MLSAILTAPKPTADNELFPAIWTVVIRVERSLVRVIFALPF
jgi:hypothetical protein